MALADLEESLINNAKKEAAEKFADANKRAKAILEDAKKRAESVKQNTEKQIESEKELIERELRASIDIEKKIRILEAIKEIADSNIDSIIDELKSELEDKEILSAIVNKALSYIDQSLNSEKEHIIIYVGPKTQKLISKAKDIKVKKGDKEGLIVTNESESIKVDMTIDNIISRYKNIINAELIKLIRDKFNEINEQGK